MTLALQQDDELSFAIRQEVRAFLQGGGAPKDIPGLCTDPYNPPLDFQPVIIDKVDRKRGQRVVDRSDYHYCPFCNRHRQFVVGYVILCPDGRVRLIGNCCYRGHGTAAGWDHAFRQSDAMAKREQFGWFREEAFPLAKALSPELYQAFGDTRYATAVGRFLPNLERIMPALSRELIGAAVRERWLTVEVEDTRGVRDVRTQREQRRFHVEQVHYLGDAALVLQPSTRPPMDRAWTARDHLDAALRLEEKTDWDAISLKVFGNHITTCCALLRDATLELEKAIAVMKSYAAFFSDQSLAGIGRWANHIANPLLAAASYEARRGKFVMIPYGEDEVLVAIVKDFQVPSLPSLAKRVSALDRFA